MFIVPSILAILIIVHLITVLYMGFFYVMHMYVIKQGTYAK